MSHRLLVGIAARKCTPNQFPTATLEFRRAHVRVCKKLKTQNHKKVSIINSLSKSDRQALKTKKKQQRQHRRRVLKTWLQLAGHTYTLYTRTYIIKYLFYSLYKSRWGGGASVRFEMCIKYCNIMYINGKPCVRRRARLSDRKAHLV